MFLEITVIESFQVELHPAFKESTSYFTSAFNNRRPFRLGLAVEDDPLGTAEDWKAVGTEIIENACREAGATKFSIDWKPGRIIVTVEEAETYVSPDDTIEIEEDEADYEDEEVDFDANEESTDMKGVDVTVIARAINNALDADGDHVQNDKDDEDVPPSPYPIGWRIAETHEIEVTTPGASDVLVGDVMFNAYRGFDVIAEVREVNKKTGKEKKKLVEGRLVERNVDVTIINVKGRMSKFKNELVDCVRLPKAKKEKR